MLRRIFKETAGFTLVELLIVLAILGILIAVVLPNLTGFLSTGKSHSYDTDTRTIQAGVDAYYTDTTSRRANTYPVQTGVTATNVITVVFDYLTSGRFLKNVPRSSNQNPNSTTTADGSNPGHYVWKVDTTTGLITSTPAFNGTYP